MFRWAQTHLTHSQLLLAESQTSRPPKYAKQQTNVTARSFSISLILFAPGVTPSISRVVFVVQTSVVLTLDSLL